MDLERPAVTGVPVPVPGFTPVLGDSVPALLTAALERRHLDDLDPDLWRTEVGCTGAEDDRPTLRRLVGVGRPRPGEDRRAAMERVLSAAQEPGFTQVVVLYGDGARHEVHIGGRRVPAVAGAGLDVLLEGQARALAAHAPGGILGPPVRMGEPALAHLDRRIGEAPVLATVTGTPWRDPDGIDASLLDRLVAAAAGMPHLVTVVAEPIPGPDVDATIALCRSLRTELHALVRRTAAVQTQESTARGEQIGDIAPDVASPLLASLLSFAAIAVPTAAPLLGVAASVIGSGRAPGAGMRGPERSLRVAETLAWSASTLMDRRVRDQRTTTTSTTTTTTTGQSRSESVELLDAHAEAAEALLRQWTERLEASRAAGWWSTSVHVAVDDEAALAAVVSALRGRTAAGDGAAEPVHVVRPPAGQVREAMGRGEGIALRPRGGMPGNPLGGWFDRLATPLPSGELAALVALPGRPVPGLPARREVEFSLTAPEPDAHEVALGSVVDGRGRAVAPIGLSAATLNRHTFIAGMPGYGKTTTATEILVGAWTELGVPFLVIEPAKTEYRRLADHPRLRDHLQVFSIGDPGVAPLRLNPLMPVRGAPLFRHVDLLKAVFNASFPMFAGMSYVLDEAIVRVYEERGWDLESSANVALADGARADDVAALVPTVADLHDTVERVLDDRGYAREVHQNMGAALRSRLRSLTVGAKGLALGGARSVPADDLFDRPCVVELHNLGDDEEKSFVMALLLTQLFEYAEARRPDPGARHPLVHLTLVEEAHRLLRAAHGPSGGESADAQAKAVRLFTDLLAEMRAYGEGFVVADQVPSALAPDVIKNSTVRILHRLGAADDRAVLSGAMDLTDEQSRHLVTLGTGTAVMHDDRLDGAALVQVVPRASDAGTATDPGTERPAARAARPRHLQRNGGCVACPRPCTFRARGPAGRPDPALRAAEALLDALENDAGAGAARAWARWCRLHGDDPTARGRAYCALTQLAHARFAERAAARCRAVGLPSATPEERLRADRAARVVGRLCGPWAGAASDASAASDPDDAAFATAAAVLADLTAAPPVELAGCPACPSRCRALAAAGPAAAPLRDTVRARITMTTPAAARARQVLAAVDGAGLSDPGDRRAVAHCLAALAVPEGSPELDAVLAALPHADAAGAGAGAAAGGPPTPIG